MKRLLLILTLLLAFVPSALSQSFSERDIMVPAVTQDTETDQMVGIPVRLNVKMITPGTGEIFVNTRALTQMDMQGSARLAAMVAGDLTGQDVEGRDFLVTLYANSTIIGGPSAGAAMTVAISALLEGLELREDVMMTGMITLDGAVGVVGGIPEKAYAAHLSGANYFLVPEGQAVSFNSTFDEVNVTELAWERWNITVVEISDVREAITWFTGREFPPREYPTTPVRLEDYQNLMRRQSAKELELANASLMRTKGLLETHAANLSESLISDLESDLNMSGERLMDAYEAYNQSTFYVASSKAFQSRITSRSAANYIRYYAAAEGRRDEIMAEIWSEAEEEIVKAEKWVNQTIVHGITGIECLAAAEARVKEAEKRLADSRDWYDLGYEDMAVFEASFSVERAFTAILWANITAFFPKGPSPGPDDFKETAEGLFADASILATYADLLYEEVFGLPISWVVVLIEDYAFIDPYESLDRAEMGMDDEKWAMATFEALESEMRSGLAIEFINVLALAENMSEANDMMRVMANKSRVKARIAIEDSREIGVEPVLSVSRYEFSEDLSTMDEISALGEAVFGFRIAASIARLSPSLLDLYRPSLMIFPFNESFILGDWPIEGEAFDPNQDEMVLTVEAGSLHLEVGLDSGPFMVSLPTTDLPDGRYEITLNLSDGTLFDFTSINATVDNHPPAIDVYNINNNTVYGFPMVLNLTVWDGIDPNPNFTIDLNGGPFPINGTIPQGWHILIVRAVDMAGLLSEVRLNFSIDMEAPIIDLEYPDLNGTWLVPPTKVRWAVYDNLTGIRECMWRMDSGKWELIREVNRTMLEPGWAGLFSLQLDAQDGQHILSILATDLGGNNATATIEFVLDRSPPEIVITGVVHGELYNHDLVPEISVTDLTDPSPQVVITLDGVPYQGGTTIGEGRHSLKIAAMDKAGNEEILVADFTIDVTSPTIWANVTDGVVYGRAIYVEYRVSENLDPYPRVEATLDGKKYSGGLIPTGFHTLKISAMDMAGNFQTLMARFAVDISPPMVLISVEEGRWYGTPVNLSVSVEDDLDPRPSINATLDGLGYDAPHLIDEGKHVVSVEAVDHAGNLASRSITFYVDSTPPLLSLTGVEEGGGYNYWVLPELEVQDAVDGSPTVQLQVDGEPFTLGTRIRDGEHEISIVARDRAGNERRLELSFIVDTDPPVIAMDIVDGAEYRGSVTPDIDVTDNYGNLTSKALLDGGPYEIGKKIGPGSHVLIVEATDWVGNIAKFKVVFIVRDKYKSYAILLIIVPIALACLIAYRRFVGRKQRRRQTYRFRG